MTIIVALPVKTYAFLTMNVHGWLTRSADQLSLGGEAQSASSLS
jgi:hyaluronan synthase